MNFSLSYELGTGRTALPLALRSVLLLILVLLQINAVAAQTPVDKTSMARKEQDMTELKAARMKLEDEIRQIESGLKDFNTARDAVDKLEYSSEHKERLEAVRAAFTKLKDKQDDPVKGDKDLLTFAKAITALFRLYDYNSTILSPDAAVTALSQAERHFRVRMGQKSLVSDVLSEAGASSPGSLDMFTLEKTDALLDTVAITSDSDSGKVEQGTPSVVKWTEMGSVLQDAAQELGAFKQTTDQALSKWKTVTREYLQKAIGSLSAAKASRAEQEKELGRRYDELDKQVLQSEEAGKGVDRLLTYAVYGMVAAIFLMFITLTKWTDSKLAEKLVEERTMIELLSMGFLLLTIIILGTGEKLKGETLGALLGTIAGYIFGRKEGERRGAQEERKQLSADIKAVADKTTVENRAADERKAADEKKAADARIAAGGDGDGAP